MSIRKKSIVATATAGALAVFLCAPVVASAAESYSTEDNQMDTGKAGMMKSGESEDQASQLFYALDTNHDGKVSRDELKVIEDLQAKYDDVDTNHDGGIDATEFSAFEATLPSSGQAPSNKMESPEGGASEDKMHEDE